jgi:hypothetical protein
MSNTPDRIHNWQNSQLSIARFYGGIKFNGAGYTIAVNEEGQPLVRDDVLKAEAAAKRVAKNILKTNNRQASSL